MKKFNDRFRVESIRLQEWDYSNPWWYYVTICTKDHEEFLGRVLNEEMILDEPGWIAQEIWKEIPKHFPNIELDYFVIMPNHIHGIIIIKGRAVACNGSTESSNYYSAISPKTNSLSSVVRSFKSAVTKKVRENGYQNFYWQSRFYDRIIRNEKELFRIRKYILENPLKWDLEKNIPENME